MQPSDSIHRRRQVALGVALAVLVLWLPLPLGGVLPVSHTVLQVAAAAALAGAAFATADVRRLRPTAVPAAAILAVAMLGLLQSLPWPRPLAALAAPGIAALTPGDGTVALSLAPGPSRAAALGWSAMAALLLAATVAGRRTSSRRALFAALVMAGVFQVLLGARHWMAGSTSIWGIELRTAATRLRGTFANPDHLALYLAIVLAAVFAWVWWSWRRLSDHLTPERRLALVGPPLLVWATLFAGLAFTGSRAGLVAGTVTPVAQGLLAAAATRRWRGGVSGVLAAAAGIAVVAAVGLQAGLGRWLATSGHEVQWSERLVVARGSLELWSRSPLLGTGLSSFREAYPLVQPATLDGTWWHAHNDWLELLATAGLTGLVLVLAAAAPALRRLASVLRDGARSEDRAAALAALGACLAVAVHSVFDFGLSMQANPATLVIVVGAAAGAPIAVRRSRRKREPSEPKLTAAPPEA